MNKNFFRSIYTPDIINRVICVFSGRFQPFGPHHYAAYLHLCDKFGLDNVFVATSNSVDTRKNPLSFLEKKKVMEKYGVRNIFQVSAPYRPIEITRNLQDDAAIVLAVGEKDCDRLVQSDSSYYQKYTELPMNSYRKNGYVYVIPSICIRWKNSEIDGTLLRKELPDLDKIKFEELMGWYDLDIHNLFRDKFTVVHGTDVLRESIEEIATAQVGKHLMHPWECLDLTYFNLVELIENSISGRLKNVTEKVDGQNILVTIKHGQVLFARNKTEIKNPLQRDSFLKKFEAHTPNVLKTFTSACVFLEESLSGRQEFFNPGDFLNIEIVDPNTVNVIPYGQNSFIILHSFIQYDDLGNELNRNISRAEQFYTTLGNVSSDSHKLLPPRKLVLDSIYYATKQITQYTQELDSIWSKYNLLKSQNLGDYYEIRSRQEPKKLAKDQLIKKYQYPIEMLFSKLGFLILSEIGQSLCKTPHSAITTIRKRLYKTIADVRAEGNPSKIQKLQTELAKFESIGGTETVLAVEGIVFEFNGRLLKFTGSFRFINQVLGINRYSR